MQISRDALVLGNDAESIDLGANRSHLDGRGCGAGEHLGERRVERLIARLPVHSSEHESAEAALVGNEGHVQTGPKVEVGHARRDVVRRREVFDHVRLTRSHDFRRSTGVRREADRRARGPYPSPSTETISNCDGSGHDNPRGIGVAEQSSALSQRAGESRCICAPASNCLVISFTAPSRFEGASTLGRVANEGRDVHGVALARRE